jgi:hypothetical protein
MQQNRLPLIPDLAQVDNTSYVYNAGEKSAYPFVLAMPKLRSIKALGAVLLDGTEPGFFAKSPRGSPLHRSPDCLSYGYLLGAVPKPILHHWARLDGLAREIYHGAMQ